MPFYRQELIGLQIIDFDLVLLLQIPHQQEISSHIYRLPSYRSFVDPVNCLFTSHIPKEHCLIPSPRVQKIGVFRVPLGAVHPVRVLPQLARLEVETIVFAQILNVDIVVFPSIGVCDSILRKPAAIEHLLSLFHGEQLVGCHVPISQTTLHISCNQGIFEFLIPGVQGDACDWGLFFRVESEEGVVLLAG